MNEDFWRARRKRNFTIPRVVIPPSRLPELLLAASSFAHIVFKGRLGRSRGKNSNRVLLQHQKKLGEIVTFSENEPDVSRPLMAFMRIIKHFK